MSNQNQPRRRSILRPIAIATLILLPLAFLAYRIAWPFLTHHSDPGAASSAADVAELTSVPPPPQASGFRVASFDHGQARLVFVRFDAPADVCEKYAPAVLPPNSKLKPLDWQDRYDDLATLSMGTREFDDLSWFDLPYLRGFWKAQGGKKVLPYPQASANIPEAPDVVGAEADTQLEGYASTKVRIDTSRGVFYYMRSN
jgi:hypothetical protein